MSAVKSVFISSSDSYAFLWPAFFTLFAKHWPGFDGTIWLNTEELDYSFPGLDVRCTKVGRQKRFGETFKAGWAKVEDEFALLMMIDYFIEGRVNEAALGEVFAAFKADDGVDSVALSAQGCPRAKPVPRCGLQEEIVPPGRFSSFSFQTAIWRTSRIGKYIADWETPWMAEYFGCWRADLLKSRIWCLREGEDKMIPYDGSGVVHGGGRWNREALGKLDLVSIPLVVDDARGYWSEPRFPRLSRIPKELPFLHLRLLSYLSLVPSSSNRTDTL